MKYIFLVGSIFLSILGQILLKRGVQEASLTLQVESIIRTLLHLNIALGLTLYAISAVLWLFVLREFPLTIAYPYLSLSYILIFIGSVIFLHENVSLFQIIGAALILTGLIFLTR
jgi:multidrug transporter EmrE-like cation transporter